MWSGARGVCGGCGGGGGGGSAVWPAGSRARGVWVVGVWVWAGRLGAHSCKHAHTSPPPPHTRAPAIMRPLSTMPSSMMARPSTHTARYSRRREPPMRRRDMSPTTPVGRRWKQRPEGVGWGRARRWVSGKRGIGGEGASRRDRSSSSSSSNSSSKWAAGRGQAEGTEAAAAAAAASGRRLERVVVVAVAGGGAAARTWGREAHGNVPKPLLPVVARLHRCLVFVQSGRGLVRDLS